MLTGEARRQETAKGRAGLGGLQSVHASGGGGQRSPTPVGLVAAIVKVPRTPGGREGGVRVTFTGGGWLLRELWCRAHQGDPSPVGPSYCESYNAAPTWLMEGQQC